jgi:hypothetical protein
MQPLSGILPAMSYLGTQNASLTHHAICGFDSLLGGFDSSLASIDLLGGGNGKRIGGLCSLLGRFH